MQLIFSTQNKNKVEEIQSQLKNEFSILSLADLEFFEELAETSDTLEGNALQKARFIHDKFGKNVFADDTGLEIDALHGDPGVRSARYAGEGKSFEANMGKVLQLMKNEEQRTAQFRTVIALIFDQKEYLFEGICTGDILSAKRGSAGFGYDPIFCPTGYKETFAEMPMELKNKISHRGKAVQQLIDFLNRRA